MVGFMVIETYGLASYVMAGPADRVRPEAGPGYKPQAWPPVA